MSIGWFAHIYAEYMEPGYGVYGLKDGEKKGREGDKDAEYDDAEEFDAIEGSMGGGGAYGLAGHGGKDGKKAGEVGDLKIAFAPRTEC